MGIEAGITPQDHIITAYRAHGIAIGRGVTPFELLAEMLGRKSGKSHGKGGSMHITHHEKRFYGGNGIVGAQVPIGTGIAFGIKYEGKKEVCVTMYGDGAANQGQVAEAANMAKLWMLPVIYICENNLYGMGTSVERASANTKFYTRLDTIPGIKINGQNVFAVREALKFSRNWCIQGKGPICLEIVTYRYHGHSMSDAGLTYRNRDEISKVRKERDPIQYVKGLIVDNKFGTEDELKKIDKEIRVMVEAAATKARGEAWPDPEKDLFTDIYGDGGEKSMDPNWLTTYSVHEERGVR